MTDLDQALRAMLRERAGDIDSVPVRVLAPDTEAELDRRARPAPRVRPPTRRIWPLAAAAAAVLAVAGSVVVIDRAVSDRSAAPSPSNSARPAPTTPATPTASASRSAGPAPSPKPVAACSTKLPAAWAHALANSALNVGDPSAMPVSVTPSGQILAARDTGSSRDVVLLGPTGAIIKTIYRVPEPDLHQVAQAQLAGNQALITIAYDPRSAVTIIPSLVKLLLIDLDTGRQQVLDQETDAQASNGGRTMQSAALLNGHVYWDVQPSFNSPTGQIRDYDIATGRATTVFTGPVNYPTAVAAGVTWGYDPITSVQVAAQLPAAVQSALGARAAASHLATDGRSYAWITPAGLLGWWAPGSPQPRYVRLPADQRPTAEDQVDLIVAGSFVAYDGEIIDSRSGAMASTGVPGFVGPNLEFGATGAFVGYRFVGALKTSPTDVVRVDTARLPALTC